MNIAKRRCVALGLVMVGVMAWPLSAQLQPINNGDTKPLVPIKRLEPGLKEHLIPALDKGPMQAHKAEHVDATEDNGCPICPVSDAGEVHVLLALRERRLAISAREHQLERRETQLEQLASSLDGRVAALDAAMQRLEKKLNVGEAAKELREQQIATMVTSLSTMTAKKAAPMLAEADAEVATEIMRRFPPTRVAALLSAMPANKAGKFLTQAIASAPKTARGTSQAASSQSSETSATQPAADAK